MNIRPGTSKSYSLHSYEPEDEYCSNPLKYFIDSFMQLSQNEGISQQNNVTSSSYHFQPCYNSQQVFPLLLRMIQEIIRKNLINLLSTNYG